MNDELANSLDRLAWLNAELANSMGRSSAASDSQVKAWVCLKAGRLELMAQIVSNTRLPAHPGISGRGAHRRANRHRRELQPTGGAAGIETPIGGARIIHLDEKPLSASSDRRACSNGHSLQEDRHIRRHPTGKQQKDDANDHPACDGDYAHLTTYFFSERRTAEPKMASIS